MNRRTKIILAREILILIIPIISLIILFFGVGLYFELQFDALDDKSNMLSEEIEQVKLSKIDSLKKADSIEVIRVLEEMRKDQEFSNGRIENVKNYARNKNYSIIDPLTNIYGDTIHLDFRLMLEKQELELTRKELNSSIESFFGNKIYEGFLAKFYVVFLIIAYPIRLTIYTIAWAITTLKTE